MGMVRVEKDGEIEFLTQAPHQGRELPNPDKLTLPLGRADQHRNFQFARGREDRLEQDQVGNVEMADSRSRCLRLCQGFS